jgi:hypothetical protein
LDGLAQAGCITLANELAVARGFPLDAEIAKAKVRLLGPLPAEGQPAAKPGTSRSRSKAKR